VFFLRESAAIPAVVRYLERIPVLVASLSPCRATHTIHEIMIIIIANPASRTFSLSRIRQAEVFLQQGFGTELVLTHYKDHAQLLAREALEKNPYCIIAPEATERSMKSSTECMALIYRSASAARDDKRAGAGALASLDAAGAIKRVLSAHPIYFFRQNQPLCGDRFFVSWRVSVSMPRLSST